MSERLSKPREPMLNPLKTMSNRTAAPKTERPRDLLGVAERTNRPASTDSLGLALLKRKRALCHILSRRRRDRRATSHTVRNALMGRERVIARGSRRHHRQPKRRSLRANY